MNLKIKYIQLVRALFFHILSFAMLYDLSKYGAHATPTKIKQIYFITLIPVRETNKK